MTFTEPGGRQIEIRPEEAAFAELALAVPATAGFYLNADGKLVVVVRDEEADETATAQIRGIVNRRLTDGRVRSAELLVQRGEYTFFELAAWRDAVFDNVLGRVEGVVSLDLKESANRVSIGVLRSSEALVRATLPARLAALGIDTAAVLVWVQDSPLEQLGRRDARPTTRHSGGLFGDSVAMYAHWDTLVGGIPIQFIDVSGVAQNCSLGVVVDHGSTRGMVSASHCSRSFWYLDQGAAGRIFQPDTMRVVGYEEIDPGSWTCGLFGQNACRNSDASFIGMASGIQSHRGLIARTLSSAGPGSQYGSLTVNPSRPYFIIDAVDDGQMIEGQFIHKIGKTTGWTWGSITDTCYDSAQGFLFQLVVKCTYRSDMTANFGDSGSPVFALYGNGYNQNTDLVKLVGILFAKSGNPGDSGFRSVSSKWNRVVMDLGSMNAVRGTSLSAPSLSGGMTFTFPALTWSGISGATKYQVFRVKNGVTEALGVTTGTSSADGDSNVLEYMGATEPTSGVKIQYYVYALNATEASSKSNVIWFRGATGQFNVSVNGPSIVGPNNAHCSSWIAQVSGADTIISYAWSGFFTSSDSYVEGVIPESGAEFQVLVVDSQNRQGGYVMQVTYDPEHLDYCV